MACCDTPSVILQTILNNQTLLTAITQILAQDDAAMQAIAAALISSDPNNTLRLGTDGLLYENDST